MAELLLELLSEEIPARMQLPAASQLKQMIEERLNAEKLFNTGVKTYVTPRRLVLSVGGLSLTQEDSVTEKRGPRVDAPKQAIDGFLKSTGLKLDQLTKRQTDKGEFYFAVQEQKGLATKQILRQALEEIIPAMHWPKSMRWGSHSVRWVRPLKNIGCVFGGEILPLQFGHLTANGQSQGHSFLSEGRFDLTDFDDYRKALRDRSVILDTEERKKRIREQAQQLADSESLTIVEDEGLLTEVAGLVEWPVVLLGSFDANYLKVPEEALISSIRTHQKYFCLRDKKGKLASHFLVVSNMETADNGANIIAGNERVIRARLADASFFWEQDKKTPLANRLDALDRIVFHARLGTVADKTARIQALAKLLSVWIPHAPLDEVERAAALCKADLTTEMVGEFPELQGIMGAYYAEHDQENAGIANAIRDHYAPLGPSDSCPKEPTSIAVAIADKMDSLAGLFAIGEKPTGSKDPYALRRATLGIIRIILENELSIPLRILIERAIKHYPKSLFHHLGDEDDHEQKTLLDKIKPGKKVKPADVVDEIMAFFSDRLKALLKGENIRHDLIASVFDSGNEDDLLRVVKRVAALENFLATEDGQNMLAAYRRATNIVRIEEKNDGKGYKGNPNKSLLKQAEEELLFERLQQIKPEIKQAIKSSDFEAAMGILAGLRASVDAFFDTVTVNCDDPDVRKNRLKILAQMRESVSDIADFSLIEG